MTYRAANAVVLRQKALARYHANPQEINRRAVARIKADPVLRLRRAMSVRLSQVLRQAKSASWQVLVGYSVAELRAHLESQFDVRMTWANYGAYWHVDHIIPVAKFCLPEQIRECWALSTLRPLEARENQRKGAR